MMQAEIKSHYDVVIVGAGPAGMTAAVTLSGYGLSVAVFDEQSAPGGQVYRNVQKAGARMGTVLCRDRFTRASVDHGLQLVRQFIASDARYFAESFVWYAENTQTIAVKYRGRVYQTSCRYLVLAQGAMERPVAFTGWQLPGVMGVGAAQTLLKSAGSIPASPPVLFGGGPLLLLYATQLLAAGTRPAAILNTAPLSNSVQSLKYLHRAAAAPTYLKNGLQMLAKLRSAKIPTYHHVVELTATGSNKLERIEFHTRNKSYSVETALLLSHHGVIPETRLMRSINLGCLWDDSSQCWRPELSACGLGTVDGVYVVGDGAAINGAYSAEYDARIACLDILSQTGLFTKAQSDHEAAGVLTAGARDKKIRRFLESKYRVPESLICPSGETLVCRCESVTATEIEAAVAQGCVGPNQVKSFTRCGMGACQGRMCGPAVEAIIAKATGRGRDEVGCFRARPPVRPVSLGEIASLDTGNQDAF